MSRTSFVRGAAILGLAGIFVKILGAVYQIPFVALIGADGASYYSPAYYLYTIFIVIATSGIPVAISRMVSERVIVQNHEGAHRVFHISMNLMFGIGVVSFVIMFFGADFLAQHFAKVPESALAMRTIAPALIIVPVMASFRGYYQGQQNMKPTALSQIVEQVFRVCFGLATAYLLYHSILGLFSDHDKFEKGAAGGAFGATMGSVGGLAIMAIIYLVDRKNIKSRVASSKNVEPETNKEILKKILWISIPITIGACIAPIMSFLDSPLVISRLTATGWGYAAAKNLYGQISGYVMPLINLPQALSMALSMSLVPLISSAKRTNDIEGVQKNTSLAVRLAVMIGMPCAAGMAVLAEPILLLLYSSHEAEAVNVAPTFVLYALSIVLIAIVQTVSGILQGMGKQLIPVRNMIIGIAIKIVLTLFFVGFHSMNIKGAGLASLITYLVVAGLDLYAVRKYTKTKFRIGLTYIRPLIATLVMSAAAWGMYHGVFHNVSAVSHVGKLACLISVLVAAIVYVIMLLVTKSVEREDLQGFGIGQKLLGIADRIGIKF